MSERAPRDESSLLAALSRIAVSSDRIEQRVAELGRQVYQIYEGQEMTIVAVLTGALIFLADLIRRVPLQMRLHLVSVSTYPGRSVRSQGEPVVDDIPVDLADRHVLVVDDILDSGRTLGALLVAARRMRPASLRTCVLLRKDRPDLPDRMEADLHGFDVPDEFLVGYGLDFDGQYRNLPFIGVLAEHDGSGRQQEEGQA